MLNDLKKSFLDLDIININNNEKRINFVTNTFILDKVVKDELFKTINKKNFTINNTFFMQNADNILTKEKIFQINPQEFSILNKTPSRNMFKDLSNHLNVMYKQSIFSIDNCIAAATSKHSGVVLPKQKAENLLFFKKKPMSLFSEKNNKEKFQNKRLTLRV